MNEKQIEIVKGLGAKVLGESFGRNVLGESFGRNVLGESFFFEPYFEFAVVREGEGSTFRSRLECTV